MKRLAIILSLMSGPVGAQNLDSGNLLLDACDFTKRDYPNVETGYCIGYLRGVWEGMKLGIALPMMMGGERSTDEIEALSNRLLRICIPEKVEQGQLVDIAINYLATNPETRHLPARMLVQLSYAEAFPCE